MQNSPIIAEMVENDEIKIAGCMYDLESGAVEFYDWRSAGAQTQSGVNHTAPGIRLAFIRSAPVRQRSRRS